MFNWLPRSYIVCACFCRDIKTECGNLLSDMSDHLPNYLLLITDKAVVTNDRPMVRLYSDKAREQFVHKLGTCDWSDIYSHNDVNLACNLFSDKVQTYFNDCFPLVRLSRKRARDKKWITSALKKASRTKAKLYKIWVKYRSEEAEENYKAYKRIFKKVSHESEALYSKEMFDKRNNTVTQIWKNLNTVCSFKSHKTSKKTVNRILHNGCLITDPNKICVEFNNYFTTVGVELMKNIDSSCSGNNYQKTIVLIRYLIVCFVSLLRRVN